MKRQNFQKKKNGFFMLNVRYLESIRRNIPTKICCFTETVGDIFAGKAVPMRSLLHPNHQVSQLVKLAKKTTTMSMHKQ